MIKQADSKGRVSLPGFANATVIVEQLSPSEYSVKRAKVIPEADLEGFEEPHQLRLSEADALLFLDRLENPPPPTEAAKAAAKEYVTKYGHPLERRRAE